VKRVSPKDAFVGESLPDDGEGADEAVIMTVRGGELVALVPSGTEDARLTSAATLVHGTLRLETGRLLHFEIRKGVSGASFEDESGKLGQRRQTSGAGAPARAPRTAGDVMTQNVITANPDMLVEDIAKQLAFHNISGMPVEDNSGQIVGVISEIDVIGRIGSTVSDVMTPEVISVTAETTVEEAAVLMAERRIKRLPVMSGDSLIGIVSRADIVRAVAGGA